MKRWTTTETHGRVDGAPLAHQQVQVSVRDLVGKRAIVGVQRASVLCHPDSGHPLVELTLRVDAEIADVLGVLGLDLRVLDPEAEVCRGLEFSLPANAIVDLAWEGVQFN